MMLVWLKGELPLKERAPDCTGMSVDVSKEAGGAARTITELSQAAQALAATADTWTVVEHAPLVLS